jgi:hypothetical protein
MTANKKDGAARAVRKSARRRMRKAAAFGGAAVTGNED